MRHAIWIILATFVSIFFSGCTCSRQDSQTKDKVTSINLFVWGEYTSPRVLKGFQEATGISVIETNFASNEEMLAKLQAGATGYDVVIPSDYMVSAMVKLGLLAKLDHSKLPNFAGIDELLLAREYDPENQYSVPYSWSVSGIAYRKDKVSTPITSYKDLFERPDLKGHVALLDDMREAVAAAMRIHGHGTNDVNKEDLAEAAKTLKTVKSQIKEFNSTPATSLLQGDLVAAQMYSNEALRAQLKNNNLEFVLPSDGFTMSIDNMVILNASTKKDAAHAFINFIISESSSAHFTEDVIAAPVNKSARDNLPPNLKSNPILASPRTLHPTPEMQKDLGEFTADYDRVWTEVKAGS